MRRVSCRSLAGRRRLGAWLAADLVLNDDPQAAGQASHIPLASMYGTLALGCDKEAARDTAIHEAHSLGEQLRAHYIQSAVKEMKETLEGAFGASQVPGGQLRHTAMIGKRVVSRRSNSFSTAKPKNLNVSGVRLWAGVNSLVVTWNTADHHAHNRAIALAFALCLRAVCMARLVTVERRA